MSGGIKVDTNALRNLASNLEEVKSSLLSAQTALNGAILDGGVFSELDLGGWMGGAYTRGNTFAAHDAGEQAGQIGSIQDRLHQTAQLWDDTEEANTVVEC